MRGILPQAARRVNVRRRLRNRMGINEKARRKPGFSKEWTEKLFRLFLAGGNRRLLGFGRSVAGLFFHGGGHGGFRFGRGFRGFRDGFVGGGHGFRGFLDRFHGGGGGFVGGGGFRDGFVGGRGFRGDFRGSRPMTRLTRSSRAR